MKELENEITCQLCGLVCSMQISASHLRAKHSITTKEYRSLGYQTVSPARLQQLRESPVGSGECSGVRGKFGKDHWNWKGGHVNSSGYRVVYDRGRKRFEHRVVAENILGRPLAPNEVVHHIDGNRINNTPENLVVMTIQEHNQMKIGTRAFHHTNKDCEEAAKLLVSIGWSKSKIMRALRIHRTTFDSWIKKP